MLKNNPFGLFFNIMLGNRTELLRALMAMKQNSVASEEKFLSSEILEEKDSLSDNIKISVFFGTLIFI
jgi:hypothetical protein